MKNKLTLKQLYFRIKNLFHFRNRHQKDNQLTFSKSGYAMFISFALFSLMFFGRANAQNGLENIIVEKYYISNANDATVNGVGGVLPVGSVTYRIYVDMLAGYKFQAAYGVAGHELRLATTTSFFNNIDRGATTPTYTKAQAVNNTVMLDSWFSVGAATSNTLGILKAEDDGVANVVNADGVLQNNDLNAGIPLTTQDGLITGTPQLLNFVGLGSATDQFGDGSVTGNLLSTFNGSWASLSGSAGPTSSNKVLIAQITTDGCFSFELNIQIGTPLGGVQNYVARNPVGNEIKCPGLLYNASDVSIAASPSGSFCQGTNVTFTATPNNGGATPTYQWKVNGGNVGTNSPTYSTTSLNNNDQVTCVMTSSDLCVSPASATSNAITVTVNPSPVVVASPPSVSIAVGTSTTLAASGAVSYSWNPGGGSTSTVSVSPTTNTTYTVTGTSANGCTATATSTVTVYGGKIAVFVAASNTSTNTTGSIVELDNSTSGQTGTSYPIDGTTMPNALRFSGSATSTAYLANSNDGTLLCFTGHNSTTTGGNANAILARGVGTINSAHTINLATTYTGGSGNQTRCATSVNNSTWYIGDQGGLYANGTSSASPSGNFRGVKSFGGIVYAQSSTVPVGVISAPTGGTLTLLNGLTASVSSLQDFYLISSGSNGNTYDVLYLIYSNAGGSIAKYSLVSGSWTANGTYATGLSGFGLAAEKSGSGANLYFTEGTGATGNNLVTKAFDAAGWNATINVTTANNVTLYTAPTVGPNTGTAKGVAFAPVPCATGTAAVLSGGATICSGGSANLSVAVTGGTSPFTVVYSDGSSNLTVNGYTSGANIPVSTTSTKTYSLLSVTSAGGCSVTGLSGTATVTVSPASTAAVLSGTSTICNDGTSTNLVVTITGGASPYTVVYTNGISNFTVSNYVSGTNIPITPATSASYSLVSVTSAVGCPSTGLSGTAIVTVRNRSTAAVFSGTASICTGSSTNLSVVITGGTSPFTVVYTDGSTNFTVNNYVSGTGIPVSPATTTTYSLVSVTGAFGCLGIGLSGTPTVTVNPIVTPSVSIGVSPGTTICSATNATITATATNGGVSPNYEFFVNTVSVQNGTSNTYSSTGFLDGDVITCTITSNAPCVTAATANSNSITLTVTGSVTADVSIAAAPGNSICLGSNVTFTATPTNGGPTPSYQWQVNGGNVGTNSDTYSSSSLANNDQVICLMTSSVGCASPATVTSNTITMAVANVIPSVSIAAVPGITICSGTNVTFMATPTNGGSSPSYQWLLNGGNVGSNSPTYVNSTLATNDQVQCVMTSNAACVSSNPATSNTLTFTVAPQIPAITSFSPASGLIGTLVTINGSGFIGTSSVKFNGVTASFTVVNANQITATVPSGALTGKITVVNACASALSTLSFVVEGLENIIVEKYYISNANDATVNATGGVLPVGSTTYRIYVDMLPGYKFQAAYGVPGHELRIATTSSFFNNMDRGTKTANTINNGFVSNNTVMLDSWLSTGAASSTKMGILKSEDDGVANVVNSDGVLLNNDVNAGIPLTSQDGFITGTPEAVTFVGLSTATDQFDDGSVVGNLLSTTNGSWASLNGSTGPVPATNKVLIGQITTDGCFSFELNIQIGTPSGGVQNYVAKNPAGNEIQKDVLIYPLVATNTPSVSIAASPAGTICAGTNVTFTATPTNGGVTPSYQWQKNGTNVGINSPTYSDNALANNDAITCILTSSISCPYGNPATSNVITMTVNPAPIVSVSPPAVTIVQGGSTTLTAGGAVSYSWNPGGALTATATVNPAATTTYTVTATDAAGCTATTTATVTVAGGDIDVFVAAASANNTTGSILELNPSTANQVTPVNTYPISGTGINALKFSGSATSTGYLANTNDGTLLCFTGVNSTATGNVNAINPRGVGTINSSGSFTLQTTYNALLTSAPQTRCATSLDNVAWYIGDQSGLYTNGGISGSASPAINLRGVKSFGGIVYGLQASSTLANTVVGILSAPSGGTFTGLTGLINNANAQDFYMVSSGTNGSSFDLLYIIEATANNVGAIRKYSLVGGTWTANGSYATPFGGFGIAAKRNGAGADLFVSTGLGALVNNVVLKLNDAAGFNTTINITTANNVTLYTATGGAIIKGVAFAPLPCATGATAVLSGTATICNGNSTNLAVAVTGGTSPFTVVYSDGSSYFTVNGYTSGSNIPVSPTSNTTYSLVSVTSAGGCAVAGLSGTPVVTMATPSTAAVLSGTATICNGSSTDLTVAITGGTSPFTVVYFDGTSNSTVNNYTSSSPISVSPASTKTYSLVSVTGTGGCVGTGLSGTALVTVNPTVTPAVSIVSDATLNTVCGGTSVTFTATPTNGGTTPSYQWKLNGNNVGTNSTIYTNATLIDGDQVTCVLTSNAVCATSTTANSNTITMTVNALPTVSAGTYGSLCNTDAAITLTETPSGGTFSGTGVTANTFDPAAVGVVLGNNTITYSYTNPGTGCSNTATTIIEVNTCATTVTLNLTLYLQGYYSGTNEMRPVRVNQSVGGATGTETDAIDVELYDPNDLVNAVATASGVMLNTDGTAPCTFPSAGVTGVDLYIVVKHRNSIKTWSALPVTFGSSVSYDFSSDQSQAYLGNMIDVGSGVWALYTGDLNQDGHIDSNDYPQFDNDNFNSVNGVYAVTDMNGDGHVDSNDYPIFDNNNFNSVQSVHP